MPIVGGVIYGVLWIVTFLGRFGPVVMTALQWFGRALPIFWKYLTAKNLFLLWLAGWGISALLGRGDEYIAFTVDKTVKTVETVLDFFFNSETGWFWDACIEAVRFGFGFLEIVEETGVFEPLVTYSAEVGWALRLIGMLNEFFPVAEIGVLLGIYFVFISVFIFGKFILKLIPGIG